MPRTRSVSLSETRTISSTKPCCFFRIGSTFSLTVFLSSLDFPDLLLMQKSIFQYGRLAKKEAESALAPMAEVRSYAIAMLAETTGYMDRRDEDCRLDEPERESSRTSKRVSSHSFNALTAQSALSWKRNI